MKRIIYLIISFIVFEIVLFPIMTKAEIVLEQKKYSIKEPINEWILEFNIKYKNKSYVTECRFLQEIPKTLFCLSDYISTMNMALLRAGIFIEGYGFKKGTIIHNQNYQYKDLLDRVLGHDLMSKDLKSFYNSTQQRCQQNENLALSDVETEYFENMLMPLAAHDDFVLIAVAAKMDSKKRDKIIGHELLHAQYFSSQKYQNTVHEYWKNLTSNDKNMIVDQLGKQYDKEDEALLMNEFQAYVLMKDGVQTILDNSIIQKHRPLLSKKLSEQSISPIEY